MKTTSHNKKAMPAVDHSGHRQRLRKRAAAEGIGNFELHNLLELLLFYTIPRADTNETGHRLLDRFGSFAAVLDASCEDLMQVHGVGPETAQFLNMLPDVFRIYMKDKKDSAIRMENVEDLTTHLLPLFVGQTKELLYMVCLQAGNTLGRIVQISEGTSTEVPMQARRIVSEAILSGCTGVVLAHNHPSGSTIASYADFAATSHIAKALNAVDVPLIEHFVFADGCFEPLSKDIRFTPYFGTAFRTTAKKIAEEVKEEAARNDGMF